MADREGLTDAAPMRMTFIARPVGLGTVSSGSQNQGRATHRRPPSSPAFAISSERPVPTAWYTRQRAFPCRHPNRLPRPARRRDRRPRLPCGVRMGRLAPRTDLDSGHRLVLVVGGLGVRQPGSLRLLRRLPPARGARMGWRDDLVCQASRALALGTLGEAVRASARQAQPAYLGRVSHPV